METPSFNSNLCVFFYVLLTLQEVWLQYTRHGQYIEYIAFIVLLSYVVRQLTAVPYYSLCGNCPLSPLMSVDVS